MRRLAVQFIKALVVLALWAGVVSVLYGTDRVKQLLYPIHYAGTIGSAAQEHGVDPFIVAAIVKVESRFRPGVVSSRGARGLMQIMPDTGRWAAEQLRIEAYYDDMLMDPEVNVRIGSWYLRRLLDAYKGDIVIALAAYNGGPANVDRWLAEGRWSGRADELAAIPFPETAEYVRRVTTAYKDFVAACGGRFPARPR